MFFFFVARRSHFAHKQMKFFRRVHKGAEIDEIIDIPDVMFNSARLRRLQFYDELLLTMTRQPIQQVDSAVTQGVRRRQRGIFQLIV